MRRYRQLSDPPWFGDLDIEGGIRKGIRAEAEELFRKDRSFLNRVTESDPERAARRLRARLGGQDRIGWRICRILSMVGLPIILVAGPMAYAKTNWIQMILFYLVSMGFLLAIDSAWFKRQVLTPHYATILRGHGIVVCPKCGYHAANHMPESICPECGLEDPLAD